jgi:hypothetical protein
MRYKIQPHLTQAPVLALHRVRQTLVLFFRCIYKRVSASLLFGNIIINFP